MQFHPGPETRPRLQTGFLDTEEDVQRVLEWEELPLSGCWAPELHESMFASVSQCPHL